jgi:Uma2 family endonuclease
MLGHQGPWTFEEFVQLEGEHGERFELVDGALIVSPPPPVFHQAVARRSFLQLHEQCPADLEGSSYREVLRATGGGTVDVPGSWRIDLDVVRQE